MPITITPPPTGFFGPGARVITTTDFIGPMGANVIWGIRLFGGATFENEIQRWAGFADERKSYSVDWQITTMTGMDYSDSFAPVPDNAPVRMVVSWGTQPFVTPIEQNSVDLVWSNQGLVQQGWRLRGGSTPGGGLTPEQQLQLQRADVASQLTLSGDEFGKLIGGATSLISQPPLFFTCELAGPSGVSGTGTLALPHNGLAPLVVGLTWIFTVIPPGTGVTLGSVPEYEGRMLQTVANYVLNHNVGRELPGEVQDWNVDHIIWIWNRPLPSNIGYSIRPGVVLNFSWLQLCAP